MAAKSLSHLPLKQIRVLYSLGSFFALSSVLILGFCFIGNHRQLDAIFLLLSFSFMALAWLCFIAWPQNLID